MIGPDTYRRFQSGVVDTNQSVIENSTTSKIVGWFSRRTEPKKVTQPSPEQPQTPINNGLSTRTGDDDFSNKKNKILSVSKPSVGTMRSCS